MSVKKTIQTILSQEDLNFLLTNRIPRNALTRFIGWFSQIENPLVAFISIKIWQFFSALDLSEAKERHFKSMHACFTRELKPNARPINPDLNYLVSPCDALIGAFGQVKNGAVFQAKGFAYPLDDLIPNQTLAKSYEGCEYVTLRLTSSMYHRFHAPAAMRIRKITYISGDTWNVNPIALKRVERLFCKNERAVIECELNPIGTSSEVSVLTLVPVAAILVASIRLHCLNLLLHLKYQGPNQIDCDVKVKRGEELGWFQHGSTIIVFAPKNYRLFSKLTLGDPIRMGEALFETVNQQGLSAG
ncbi:archaetidylserine decarboxylase [Polynucleobacter sp. CS-Odin-A6]|uniref:archaetidylserine decarboxylase n=1 Tax=Polynucleobacter sp. CS-Odin-A6 TaxID=2689106 RepID=UPI001C0AFB1C|nr:archaetidylserine decarboxylase [Polynucleobacter sp. CS-Odin-A6]MBU3620369.1 phosphatidylserine decarboxylase [Polynucleobacter sp. CS-Odin-A6]